MDVIKYIKTTFIVSMVMLILFYVYGQTMLPNEKESIEFQCNEFISEWEQILDDGERVSVTVPGKVEAKSGEVVRFATTLPNDVDENMVLAFRTVWQDARIYVDNELRADYSTKDTRPFGKNSAFRYVFVELEEGDAGKELVYCLSTETKYSGTIRNIYIGDKISVMLQLFTESGAKNILAFFLFMLSVFCIIICLFLRVAYKKHLTISYLIIAMMLCSVWVISEMEFRQIIFHNISALSYYTYVSIMLIPVPFVLYLNEIQNERYAKIFSVPLAYGMLVFIIAVVLQVLNIAEFLQILPFAHVGIGMASICIIITICNDIRSRKIKEYTYVSIGILGLVVATVVEIVLYYMNFTATIGTALIIGLMFLLVMAIIKTGQDLMETENKKQKAILAQEAQTKFLANMSHEIRTPINAVIGMNEIILRESKDENILGYAENIKSASDMLLGLVSDILDFSKIESGAMEIVNDEYDVLKLIKDEELLLNTRAAEKKLRIHTDIDTTLPSKLYGDELHIKQVVTNLISNAVKYTAEGSVTFKVYHKGVDDDTIDLYFSIKDTGIGIKPENIEKLFDSFKRLEIEKNRNIQGTGLGLSIAKQLTELMGGVISVESEYGKGSEFIVRVRQKVADETPIDKLEEPVYEKHSNYFTAEDASVLIVDDNKVNITVIKALLKRTLIKADVAYSGKECIDKTKQKKYDIILLDHMMPELDGVDTLRIIRNDENNKNNKGIIIVLTANVVLGCREMYLNYGFNDYFSKPIQADKFDELLIKYLPPDMIKWSGDNTVDNIVGKAEENVIVSDVGLKYCMNDESAYKEILEMFEEQCNEYLDNLSIAFDKKDWHNYSIISHTLKTTSKTIGAVYLSEVSYKHEMAAKNKDAEYLYAEFENYKKIIKEVMKSATSML
ncbi:MAG: response regulator [Lachnospiraceae bacterium]|nr:response regulator [Lachnospiraceae bacterium]